jgi:hypothetical protein
MPEKFANLNIKIPGHFNASENSKCVDFVKYTSVTHVYMMLIPFLQV